MAADEIQVSELEDAPDAAVLDMLADLLHGEQDHYEHPRETRQEIRARLNPSPRFSGENHILLARDAAGTMLGICWVVLFDPGTGLEGEIAELYVRPESRNSGVARRLAAHAVELFQRRRVTFACVWTRGDNPAALAAYRSAGFAPTEQTVLTWLPLQ
jgi:ribosomal protein S18 acetylase RimI-like enzyme